LDIITAELKNSVIERKEISNIPILFVESSLQFVKSLVRFVLHWFPLLSSTKSKEEPHASANMDVEDKNEAKFYQL